MTLLEKLIQADARLESQELMIARVKDLRKRILDIYEKATTARDTAHYNVLLQIIGRSYTRIGYLQNKLGFIVDYL